MAILDSLDTLEAGPLRPLSISLPTYFVEVLEKQAQIDRQSMSEYIQNQLEQRLEYIEDLKWRANIIDDCSTILRSQAINTKIVLLDRHQLSDAASNRWYKAVYLENPLPRPYHLCIEVFRVQVRLMLYADSASKPVRAKFRNFYSENASDFEPRGINLYDLNRYGGIGYKRNVLNIRNLPKAEKLVADLLLIQERFNKFINE